MRGTSTSVHLILGAGMVGATTARRLADRGEQVRIVSRSGRGPLHPLIERIAGDATDADRLAALARGVDEALRETVALLRGASAEGVPGAGVRGVR